MRSYTKSIVIIMIMLMYFAGSALAAEGTDNPFTAGSGKEFYAKQSADFKDKVTIIIGAILFLVMLVAFFALGGTTILGMVNKASGFQDPAQKAGYGGAIISIIGMLLGFGICITFVLGIFGW